MDRWDRCVAAVALTIHRIFARHISGEVCDDCPVARCRHCGKGPDPDGDHSCTCPHPDETCPEHPKGGW